MQSLLVELSKLSSSVVAKWDKLNFSMHFVSVIWFWWIPESVMLEP